MKHLAWIIIFLAITTALVNPDHAAFWAIGQPNQAGGESVQLNNANKVIQTFSPDRNLETGDISFIVRTFNMTSRGRVTLELFEISINNNELIKNKKLATAVSNTENLTDGGRLSFWFPSVHLEKEKKYLTEVSRKTRKVGEGAGLALSKSKKDAYSNGGAFVRNLNKKGLQAMTGDLAFVVYEKYPIRSTLMGYAARTMISPIIILVCLFITTILGALIASNYPHDLRDKKRLKRSGRRIRYGV